MPVNDLTDPMIVEHCQLSRGRAVKGLIIVAIGRAAHHGEHGRSSRLILRIGDVLPVIEPIKQVLFFEEWEYQNRQFSLYLLLAALSGVAPAATRQSELGGNT